MRRAIQPRVIAAIVLPCAWSAACGPSEKQAAYEARKIALERRIRGLGELVAEAKKGSLGAAEIDLATGIVRVAIDHLDVADAACLEGVLGGGVIRYLGARGREILQQAIRARYPLAGTLSFSAQGAEIVATPRFPATKLQLRVAPSPATWARIDAILASQTGLCKWVLEQVDVKQQLAKQFQEKGFGVKLPLHEIKPFRFPAGLSESVVVRDKALALDVRAETLRIDDTAVWLGARVGVKPAAPTVPET